MIDLVRMNVDVCRSQSFEKVEMKANRKAWRTGLIDAKVPWNSIRLNPTVPPIGHHAIPWDTVLNASTQFVERRIPRMFLAKESHVDSIGGSLFTIEPPFAVVGPANFIRNAKHNVHHSAIGFPAGNDT